MANARDIRKRIRSVKNTQQITRAMKMVSAAKLRRAQETALASRPYARKMEEMLKSIAARADVSTHPLFTKGESNLTLVVVVTGDKGLCGGFNNNLSKAVVEHIRQLRAQGREVTLYAIGKKSRDFFRRRSYAIAHEKFNVFAKLNYGDAKAIAEELTALYLSGKYGEIVLAYNEFKSVMAPRIAIETLLPIPAPAVESGSVGTKVDQLATVDYIYEPSPAAILEALVPWHVRTQIWRVLIESNAAEHAARMAAMEAATKNSGEMIDSLTLTMNKVRQAAITRELIEVVSGASALTR